MNLTQILEKQKLLDDAMYVKIIEMHPNLTLQEHRKQKMLALIVECSEFANEIQSFKYWKKNKNVSEEKAKEEFADIMHFIGSFANDFKSPRIIEELIVSQDFNIQLTQTYIAIAEAMKELNQEIVTKIFALCLGMAKLANFTEQDIELWYNKKNLTNYQRILNNY
ncbi:dUTP diphosphatase [Mycoplasmopsis alligatoris]|uniref:dUTP diphosphatase n=1 Tax=Mycoplasmopsis alligatoris A21JP2 TaxID=747682 RepID=D4XVW4_9BACT|nr:dUTP diphosphatase [Mycoplasmopsis alligatoris]EFF41512.1 dUTP diphosphatase [Mycoplasmopsis alligatoris A21JP2]